MIETQTRWKKHEKATVPQDGRTSKQIVNDERKNAFQRHAEKTNAAAIDEARSEQSPAQRLTRRGQQKNEGTRNKFGDKLQADVDPREKPLRETVWVESTRTERNGTGMPLDAVTRELRDEMKSDPRVSDRAAGRAPAEKATAQPTKPIATNDELVAYCNYVIATHPEVPLDESVRPGDSRWYQAVLTNVTNLKRAWYHLVKEKKVALNLAGLLTAFQACVDHHAFDYCRPRVRGEGAPLINIFDEVETPFAGESDELAVLRENIKSGRARVERMRNATSDEIEEIKKLRLMPFNELANSVGSKRFSR